MLYYYDCTLQLSLSVYVTCCSVDVLMFLGCRGRRSSRERGRCRGESNQRRVWERPRWSDPGSGRRHISSQYTETGRHYRSPSHEGESLFIWPNSLSSWNILPDSLEDTDSSVAVLFSEPFLSVLLTLPLYLLTYLIVKLMVVPWLSGNVVGLDQYSCSVNTWMGDRLQVTWIDSAFYPLWCGKMSISLRLEY